MIQVTKETKDCLFLLIIIQKVIIKFLLILLKNIFKRIKRIENYNAEIDGRNFYEQSINDSIKQYDQSRKMSTGQGDNWILLILKNITD